MAFFPFFKKPPQETLELQEKGAKKEKEVKLLSIERSSLKKRPALGLLPKVFIKPATQAFAMIEEMYNEGIRTINKNKSLLDAYYNLPVTETKNRKKIERALFIMFVGLESMGIKKTLGSFYNYFINNLDPLGVPITGPKLTLPNGEQFQYGATLPREVLILYYQIKKDQPDFEQTMEGASIENVSEMKCDQLSNFTSKTPDTTSTSEVAEKFFLNSDTVKAIQAFLDVSKQIAAPAPSVTPSSSSSSSSNFSFHGNP